MGSMGSMEAAMVVAAGAGNGRPSVSGKLKGMMHEDSWWHELLG